MSIGIFAVSVIFILAVIRVADGIIEQEGRK